jgi:hypothetical protein
VSLTIEKQVKTLRREGGRSGDDPNAGSGTVSLAEPVFAVSGRIEILINAETQEWHVQLSGIQLGTALGIVPLPRGMSCNIAEAVRRDFDEGNGEVVVGSHSIELGNSEFINVLTFRQSETLAVTASSRLTPVAPSIEFVCQIGQGEILNTRDITKDGRGRTIEIVFPTQDYLFKLTKAHWKNELANASIIEIGTTEVRFKSGAYENAHPWPRCEPKSEQYRLSAIELATHGLTLDRNHTKITFFNVNSSFPIVLIGLIGLAVILAGFYYSSSRIEARLQATNLAVVKAVSVLVAVTSVVAMFFVKSWLPHSVHEIAYGLLANVAVGSLSIAAKAFNLKAQSANAQTTQASS